MFENILYKIKNPVTNLIEKSQEEDLKKSGIKLIIVSAVMALINTISTVISIHTRYQSKGFFSYYSPAELSELRAKAIKEAELFPNFFKTTIILAIAMALIALVLFIIAKIVKSPREYSSNLSMVNNTVIIYTIGSILKLILSAIYAPLGIIVGFVITTYALFTLINGFRDSLDIESSDKLVLALTGLSCVIVIILALVLSSVIKSSLGGIGLSSALSLLN